MSDNFNQTVNLREKMEKERAARLAALPRAQKAPEKAAPANPPRPASERDTTPPSNSAGKREGAAVVRAPKLAESRRAENIDQVYRDDGSENAGNDLKTISRPAAREYNERTIKWVVLGLAAIVVMITAFWLFGRDGKNQTPSANIFETKWYAVKLINNETYYGQIGDTTADPVEVKNVYYDYDQLNAASSSADKAGGSLRLVKRGKETHGPDGSMDIVRSQVVYMEPLASDSKVLKAILDYEK